MPKDVSEILELFTEFPNQPFEFVIVTDINLKEHPNYYKAIFRNIKTNIPYARKITPEMMRYKYKVGHIYTNSEHVGQNPTLFKDEFTVNLNSEIKLTRMSKAVDENDAELLRYEGVKKYFLRQFAHVEEQEDCTLVIPCYTIANRFYFISSSMKHAIMSATVGELYYEGSFHPDINENSETIIQLHIKKKAGKKDLPFLCRFIGNSFAKKRLEYIANQKSLTNFEYQPIKAQFPIRTPFDIYASYICIGQDHRGKLKYLILNIHSDNSPTGIDKLYYKQFSDKIDPTTLPPKEYPVPKKPTKKFKRKKPKRNNVIYTGVPSNEYERYIIYTPNDEYYSQNTKVFGETVYHENEADPVQEYSNKTIGNSFERGSSDGDKNLGETDTSTDENEQKDKNIFNLENFFQFYEALLTFSYVEGSELSGPFDINPIKNHKRKSIKAKSILAGDEDNPRHFLYGQIAYNQKIVYILEIEQDTSWGPSTWLLFGDEDLDIYDEYDMKNIIKYYIDNDLTYEKLKKYTNEEYSLAFDYKEHSQGNIDDNSIERWCEGVLKKIIHISSSFRDSED